MNNLHGVKTSRWPSKRQCLGGLANEQRTVGDGKKQQTFGRGINRRNVSVSQHACSGRGSTPSTKRGSSTRDRGTQTRVQTAFDTLYSLTNPRAQRTPSSSAVVLCTARSGAARGDRHTGLSFVRRITSERAAGKKEADLLTKGRRQTTPTAYNTQTKEQH